MGRIVAMTSLPTGYSGKPLATKLGLKPGMKVYVDRGPDDLDLGDTRPTSRLGPDTDVVLLFCVDRDRLEERLEPAMAKTAPNGAIWACWPKKTSGVVTDLSDGVVREIGLAAGLVDVKVAAIDPIWSALKFVRRLRDRPTS